MTDDTIFAPATPPGRSALAIVRVSGPSACDAGRRLAGTLPPARQVGLRRLTHPLSGETIDEAVVFWAEAPATSTGEDVCEFHIHGGRATLDGVLSALACVPGCRGAEPGEFTRRALRNGRIDLTQAEALADLIEAQTGLQRRQALGQLGGRLSERAEAWRADLVGILAALDAELDFSDEGDVAEGQDWGHVLGCASGLVREWDHLLAQRSGEIVREGLTVLVAGPPNAGKSSLVNALAGREVAIVTEIPGTTRDLLEVSLDIAGVPVVLIDTAGLRDTQDPVERIGVERARRRADTADLVLWLSPAGEPLADAPWSDRPLIRVASKADLGQTVPPGWVGASILTPAGLDVLDAELRRWVQASVAGESPLLTRERHRRMIADARDSLTAAMRWVEAAGPVELAAEEVRRAIRALDSLVGRVDVEDVLGALFSRFCIGK